jgi:hypothetical protein
MHAMQCDVMFFFQLHHSLLKELQPQSPPQSSRTFFDKRRARPSPSSAAEDSPRDSLREWIFRHFTTGGEGWPDFRRAGAGAGVGIFSCVRGEW